MARSSTTSSGIHRQLVRFIGVVLIVLSVALVIDSSVFGEGYSDFRQLPLGGAYGGKEPKKPNHAAIVQLFPQFDRNTAEISEYYNGFLFPALTREEFAGQVAQLRLSFLEDVAKASDSKLRDYLLNLGYKNCTTLLLGTNYHPAAQVNAALILGELNLREAQGTDKGPIPFPKALKALVVSAAPGPKFSDPVQAAALLGVLRHANLRGPLTKSSPGELSAEERDSMTKLALKILNKKDPPATRTAAAHAWMRRRGVEVLGALREPGAGGTIAKRLIELFGDPTAELELKLAAAKALGPMDLSAAKPDPSMLAKSLGWALIEALDAERLALVDATSMQAIGPTAPGSMTRNPYGGGRPGENVGDVEEEGPPKDALADPRTADVRRHCLVWTRAVRDSLLGDPKTSTPGLATSLNKRDADLIIESVRATLKEMEDKTADVNALGLVVVEQRDILRKQFPPAKKDKANVAADGGDATEDGAENPDLPTVAGP